MDVALFFFYRASDSYVRPVRVFCESSNDVSYYCSLPTCAVALLLNLTCVVTGFNIRWIIIIMIIMVVDWVLHSLDHHHHHHHHHHLVPTRVWRPYQLLSLLWLVVAWVRAHWISLSLV